VASNSYRFLSRLMLREGVADSRIDDAEKTLGVKLPTEYVRFLEITNGGEGFIGENAYVLLWSVEDIARLDQAYEVQKYAPGLLVFGSSGGGEAYGFDTRVPHFPIVQVPFVGMSWELAQPLGDSFSSFLKHLYESE